MQSQTILSASERGCAPFDGHFSKVDEAPKMKMYDIKMFGCDDHEWMKYVRVLNTDK